MAGKACQYHRSNRFRVEIKGFADMGFRKVSGLKMQVEIEEDQEGGDLYADKSPGRASTENVTLERGTTDNLDDLNWFKEVADMSATGPMGSQGVGADACEDYKRNVAIIQLNRRGEEMRRYVLYNAFPVSVEFSGWDNEADEKVITKTELAYDYFTVE